MTDIWVCAACHSINEQRSARCYKCGARQADAATGAMSTLRQEQAIANRAAIAYRAATALGLAASVFLLVLVGVAIAGVALTIGFAGFMSEQLDLLRATGSFDDAAFGILIALGAFVLILLILRIDLRSRARDAEVRAVAGVR